jgi:hypothetical protein
LASEIGFLETHRREWFVRALKPADPSWSDLMRSLFIAALAIAAAGPALAQSDFPEPSAPEMSGRPMGGQVRPPERENLAQMQARMTQMFSRLDANEDGVVDASELANARGGRMLARFDADADGRITREEFDVGLAAAFKAMDKNGDGVVTADERPQRPR